MYRTEIINFLIDLYQKTTYLEIGIGNGLTLKNIKCQQKVGVDPFRPCLYSISSDEYFLKNPSHKYDVIFIDGNHDEMYAGRDLDNSLNHLNKDGIVVMHDCSPPTHLHERLRRCGTVWRTWVKNRASREDLEMYVINCDYGCGVVRYGKQKLIPLPTLTYDSLERDRNNLLNLITPDEFIKREKERKEKFS